MTRYSFHRWNLKFLKCSKSSTLEQSQLIQSLQSFDNNPCNGGGPQGEEWGHLGATLSTYSYYSQAATLDPASRTWIQTPVFWASIHYTEYRIHPTPLYSVFQDYCPSRADRHYLILNHCTYRDRQLVSWPDYHWPAEQLILRKELTGSLSYTSPLCTLPRALWTIHPSYATYLQRFGVLILLNETLKCLFLFFF